MASGRLRPSDLGFEERNTDCKTDFSTTPATVKFTNRYTYVLPGASTWTSRVFREVIAEDGTRTLYFVATDIARGFDFFKLTLPARKTR